jgi:hypothetical protein
VLTAGVVVTRILDEKWDGEAYWLKAEISADPQEVAKSVYKLRKDAKRTGDLESARRKADDALGR